MLCYVMYPAIAWIADRTGCQWPSRLSKVDNFYHIWKDVCHFPLVINSNVDLISLRFRDTATYSLTFSIRNCSPTDAGGDMVTTDSL